MSSDPSDLAKPNELPVHKEANNALVVPIRRPTHLDIGKCRAALADSDTPAFVLLTIAMWSVGDQVLGDPKAGLEPLDASELWDDLHEIFGTWVTEEGRNKLNALIADLECDPWHFGVFGELSQRLHDALCDADLVDLVSGADDDAVELMWARLKIKLAREDKEAPPEFSNGITGMFDYVRYVLLSGFIW